MDRKFARFAMMCSAVALVFVGTSCSNSKSTFDDDSEKSVIEQ